jgi:hypothetical protein
MLRASSTSIPRYRALQLRMAEQELHCAADCRSCDKSGRPSCAASSAYHKGPTLSRCFQPSGAPTGHIGGLICEHSLARSRLGKRYREPVARSIGSQASTELLDCSVISNWTGRPVFFWTIVARCRTLTPEQISSNRSLTRSQARSLLSIARLKIARSRLDRAISRRTRMDQTCFGSRGFFWPMSNPWFQGRWPGLIGRTGMERPPPPAHRVALSRAYDLYRLSSPALSRKYSRPTAYAQSGHLTKQRCPKVPDSDIASDLGLSSRQATRSLFTIQ